MLIHTIEQDRQQNHKEQNKGKKYNEPTDRRVDFANDIQQPGPKGNVDQLTNHDQGFIFVGARVRTHAKLVRRGQVLKENEGIRNQGNQ